MQMRDIMRSHCKHVCLHWLCLAVYTYFTYLQNRHHHSKFVDVRIRKTLTGVLIREELGSHDGVWKGPENTSIVRQRDGTELWCCRGSKCKGIPWHW